MSCSLTGADTVIFYDSDFNPQMDRQCEDRAHRIGQIRDVHIYRFISRHTVEEALLRKANQKRSLDDLVIASFTTGPGATTLPMRLYSAIRLGVTPEINAACTIMIGAVAIVVIAASLLLKREQLSGS